MVDIHCHVLPAVDDGAPSVEVALDMLRAGAAEGIEAAVATPHVKPNDGAEVGELHRQRLDELRTAAAAAGIPLELHQGAELGFRFGLVEVAQWPSVGLAGTRFVLVDLPSGLLSPGLEQGFFELRTSGFRPILAHPERHRELAKSPDQMARLRDQELLFQIDAGSVTGRFGRRAQAAALTMLREGWVSFIGSDGHDLSKRPLAMRAARNQVRELCGAAEARRLFTDNPRALLKGDPIAEGSAGRAQKRPSGWRRFLGS